MKYHTFYQGINKRHPTGRIILGPLGDVFGETTPSYTLLLKESPTAAHSSSCLHLAIVIQIDVLDVENSAGGARRPEVSDLNV